ncbi:hypothetical protein [Paraclostridium bifermentans]|uniref:Uncharacterized protein n=1 Tax=Paraclostridium bifermentans TaxID=1490 RepID=A0A5P3XGJ5_PARBF|nr:hypothetical protein [Paraclostridium bifermentans]MDV8113632.1 hypothetical protein [Bacillus sp. BAU-SS-2023]QEZ69467.1 hypothetical protein D4A35_11445 [Paraclostridium bifermentans]QEZ69593.1 hypothetical protein D4A35_12140 [Paraclostridium bifermentans]
MELLKKELKDVICSLESNEVLLTIKEMFIDRMFYNCEFDEVYSEIEKNEYFNKFEEYLNLMKIKLERQRKISCLSLYELYNICEYEEYDYILYVLRCSYEYIESSYIEIDMLNRNIIKHNISNDILKDLEKINKFLNLNKEKLDYEVFILK